MEIRDKHTVKTKYWHRLDNGTVQCDLCPRFCKLREGQRGLCFVRACEAGEIVLTSYGASSGFCVDPIEKKPLNHFFPGHPVLSFGTAGCNLACKFCQNWDISKSREIRTLSWAAAPDMIADRARELGCTSVAFTYNDPVIFHEYAIDVATACREQDVNSVAVTAGYVSKEPRIEFYASMDAANVDLKAFDSNFYRKVAGGRLEPVLETLVYLALETEVWFEITYLLIPGYNDSDREIDEMSRWIGENLGSSIPVHFTAFHPDWKMRDVPATPAETVRHARSIALAAGLHYVYTGNIHDDNGGSSYCVGCGELVIERDWYRLGTYRLDPTGHCMACGTEFAGRFSGPPGQWGRRRMAVSW